jgi:DNA gyrase subunit A
LLLVTGQGQIIRTKVGDLRPVGRDTQGVKVMDLAEGDRLVSIATLSEPEPELDPEPAPDPEPE